MIKPIPVTPLLACLIFITAFPLSASQPPEENRILTVVKKMEASFQEVEDYTCEVEQVFYRGGVEEQRYRFKYYFKKKKRIRVDFYYPYPTLSLFYTGGDSEVTALPLRSFAFLRFHLSVNNPKIQTLAGQKMNQTDMGYFIEFLSENLKKVPQGEEGFEENGSQVRFWFQALDYIRGKNIERYRISISKETWLPVRIERHTLEEELLESSLIKNYTVNTHLEDKFFQP
jgi:outer membrane lipoprotein-sorting protein